jgi:hypothetical protein
MNIRLIEKQRLFSWSSLFGSTLAFCAGLAIAWIDTRPHWDDTGITVGVLLAIPFTLAGAYTGALIRRRWAQKEKAK